MSFTFPRMAKKQDAEIQMTPLNTQVPVDLHRAVKVAAINAGTTLQLFVIETLSARVGVSVPKELTDKSGRKKAK